MTKNDINWELWRSFLAVLEQGNLSRAARLSGLTQPTLGRHIGELERVLGLSLFTRSPRGLAPTDAAFELRPHAQAMATAAGALRRAASGSASEAKGVVRVTAAEIVGVEILPPILTAFRKRYPGITIELAATNVTQDLLQREADIAVRMVQPTQTGLFGRKVRRIRFGLYAHRDYLKRHGTPRTMEDLLHHTLIGFDKGAIAIKALREVPSPISPDHFAFRSDSALAQQAMVRCGFGIGRGADVAIRSDPGIIPVLADKYGLDVDMWVVMHEDARNSRRMRLMFDHLVASLSAPDGRRQKRGKAAAER
jgi:DNA-binding transcriptional LysR family regulator